MMKQPSPQAVARRFLASGQEVKVTGSARNEYLSDVWAMVQTTYAAIGVKVSSPADLLADYEEWHLNIGSEGKPVAFGLGKHTRFGFKSGLSGSDGSSEGRSAAVKNLRTKFLQSGFYGEVSHKVKDIVLAAGAPVVCAGYVPEVLGKPVEPVGDIAYRRTLSGVGPVVKVMVGRPRGVPTTDAAQPFCPLPPAQPRAASWTASEDDPSDMHAHYACLAMT